MFLAVHTGLLVSIISLFFYYNYSTKKENAQHVGKVIESMLISGQYRDVVYALSNAKLGSFEAIAYYNGDNKKVFILPTQQDSDYFKKVRTVFSYLKSSFITIDVHFDESKTNKA